jgi:hypothetical protein
MKRWIGVIGLSVLVICAWFLLMTDGKAAVAENHLEKILSVRFGEAAAQKGSDLLQFTAQGHVIGFSRDGIIMAAGDHAVQIGFVNGNEVEPVPESIAAGNGKGTPSLERVVFKNLWNHIDLVYEKTSQGVIKSSYVVSPGGNPASIRLKYNGRVEIERNGELAVAYKTGKYVEAKPVCWQECSSRKEPINSTYRKLKENEVGFSISGWDGSSRLVIDPISMWNTFLGGSDDDRGQSISVDGNGNIYVTGTSYSTWGSPLRPIVGSSDAFVAKLTASGALLWNTFLGGSSYDQGFGIVVDGSNNIYVTGVSAFSWGYELIPFQGGSADAFVAKLNANGLMLWNLFLGGDKYDQGNGIAVDSSGNIYVTGLSYSYWTLGNSINPFSGSQDAFVVKLNSSGALQWNTFLGGGGIDKGFSVAVDGSNNTYVSGMSASTWGSPLNPYSGSDDAFVAKLNSSGALQWNTFLGGSDIDAGTGIVIDGSTIYVTGYSYSTWGSPLNPFNGYSDAFVAKLNASGALQWNTFLGGSSWDNGYGIALDSSSYIYITGESSSTWGSPLNPLSGEKDAFVAKLNASGALQWNTFLGGGIEDSGLSINVDGSNNAYVSGISASTWGSPLNPFGGGSNDAFVAMISLNPYVKMTSPNGGETWPLGSKHNITWNASGISSNVKLVLFKNGVKVGNIVTNLPATPSSYTWTVGNYMGGTATGGTGYTVRVITVDGAFNDYSDAPFTITPLNLVSPNGFENWQLGSVHPITWTAPGIAANIKLVLFKNGVKLGNIVTNISAGTGTYDWIVGNYIGGSATVGGGYAVRVITMDGVYRDDSDVPFAITAQSLLNLTSPNGGEIWPLGVAQAITWTTGGYSGNVKLVLFKNGVKVGNIFVDIPSWASPMYWMVGSYIEGTAAKGDGYVVRVISMDGVRRDDSDGPFVIQ